MIKILLSFVHRVWLNYRRGTVNICRFEREDLFMVDISWTISPRTGFRFHRDRTRYGRLFEHKETSRLFEFFLKRMNL